MSICYLITKPPTHQKFDVALELLSSDINQSEINQLFFFANATEIASYKSYPNNLETLIHLADEHDIELYICSAGFQARGLKFSELGQHNFKLKGLGQFIAQSGRAKKIRVF